MYQVKIEFLRIQTFLFSVPRLRNMLGANAILGQVIRCELPKLAQDCGCMLPGAVNVLLAGSLPTDPLNGSCNDNDDLDNPGGLFKRGILSRDGGHFTALFESTESMRDVDTFIDKANTLFSERLPGLRYEIFKEYAKDVEKDCKKTRMPEATEESICFLPQFQVCQESGRGAATRYYQHGDESKTFISEMVDRQRKAGKEFLENKTTTHDLLSLLESQFALPKTKRPETFEQMCGNDYLAVIVADGNRIAQSYDEWQRAEFKTSSRDPVISYLEKEAHGERFFHRMRVLVRVALVDALKKTFEEDFNGEYRPYQVMMLGGDDLLMACRAECAFSFLVHYAKALREIPDIREYSELSNKPITVGAGVAVASHTFPFHRLHGMAESLASSAKRYYRGMIARDKEAGQVSVVDWTLVSQSWSEDPIRERKRDSLVTYDVQGHDSSETLALTCRPYKIIGPGTDSLATLIHVAERLDNTEQDGNWAARSQLKRMVNELRKGRRSAELAFKEMPPETRDKLRMSGFSGLWEKEAAQPRFKTRLGDLLEVSEIMKLAKRKEKQVQESIA